MCSGIREQVMLLWFTGLRGRPSESSSWQPRFEEKVLTRVGQAMPTSGPRCRRTLSQGWFRVSRETLRTWMSKAAFWHPRSQRVKSSTCGGRES